MYRTAGRPATVRARPPLPRRADRLLEFDAHSPHDLVHLVVARVEVRREPQPVAIASLRRALRGALDPRGVMAFGERWESGGGD